MTIFHASNWRYVVSKAKDQIAAWKTLLSIAH